MKKTVLISALIAIGGLGFTATASAQDVGCDDLIWSPETLADNPNIGAACLDVVEKRGTMAAKFRARIVRQTVTPSPVVLTLSGHEGKSPRGLACGADGSWIASGATSVIAPGVVSPDRATSVPMGSAIASGGAADACACSGASISRGRTSASGTPNCFSSCRSARRRIASGVIARVGAVAATTAATAGGATAEGVLTEEGLEDVAERVVATAETAAPMSPSRLPALVSAMPASRASRGWRKVTWRPSRCTVPASGATEPARILHSVLLPDTLR